MFYVYRLFNAANELLWVGQTTQLTARFAKHRQERPWAGEIATATVTPVVDLEAALTAETEAIKIENPKYNKIEGGDPHSRFHPGYGICPRCGGPKSRATIWACHPCIKKYRQEERAKKGIAPRQPPTLVCPRCGGPKDPGPAYCKDCKKIVNREAYRRKIAGKTA